MSNWLLKPKTGRATWDNGLVSWDDVAFAWDEATAGFSNIAKNVTSFSAVPKTTVSSSILVGQATGLMMPPTYAEQIDFAGTQFTLINKN